MAIMVLAIKSNANTILFLSLSLLLISAVHGNRGLLENANVFDVLVEGADPTALVDSTMFFQKAWNAACHSNGPSRLVIPPGNYVTSDMNFQGPCTSKPITIDIQGTILASTDLSKFTDKECFLISHVEGLVVNGPGTFDGQGASAWGSNDCQHSSDNCNRLPVSIKFSFINDGVVENIKLVESKGFHMTITNCTNFVARGLQISADPKSRNTDGIHISRSNNVTVTSTVIGSGDDCISIGEGSRNVEINNITCGPGHGISIGSLGKPGDEGVSGIHVAHCLLKGTTNGARIKTFHNSPAIEASNIVFEDMTMENVSNPIIIDQHYHAKDKTPSMVKLSDIHFKNIRGTTPSNIAVSLNCSDGVPCQGVELVDIDLSFNGIVQPGALPFSDGCANAKGVTFLGKQNPPAPQCL